jgi:cytochrome c oxidase subunit 2
MFPQILNVLGQADYVNKYVDQFKDTGGRSPESSYWFPEQASSMAKNIDSLYMAIFWVSTVFFLVIVGVMCYFVIKYRRRPGVGPQPSSSHNTTIEILWSVLPSIILVWFFYQGAWDYLQYKYPPDDAEEIVVTGKKWDWTFTYPDGDQASELHLVLDRPTKLVMRSEDVLHSFFGPAFRQKMDVVPGRYTYYYVKPIMDGVFRVFCTEYCGDNHSGMKTWCHVHKDDAIRKAKTEWINKNHKAWENGERLFKLNCAGCHNINGVPATGPALNELWGREELLIDGTKVKADENYISESIKYPNAKVVAGYGPVSKMQTFEGKLSNQDIDYVIAYFKHLKQPGSGDTTGAPAAGGEGNGAAAPAVEPIKAEEPKAEPAADKPAEGTGG